MSTVFPVDMLVVKYIGVSLNGLLSHPRHALWSVIFSWRIEKPALGRGKQECCWDSLEVSTLTKSLKWEDFGGHFHYKYFCWLAISSIWPVSHLCEVPQLLAWAQGSLWPALALLVRALSHSSCPPKSELMEKCDCIFPIWNTDYSDCLYHLILKLIIIARLQHPLKPLLFWESLIR